MIPPDNDPWHRGIPDRQAMLGDGESLALGSSLLLAWTDCLRFAMCGPGTTIQSVSEEGRHVVPARHPG